MTVWTPPHTVVDGDVQNMRTFNQEFRDDMTFLHRVVKRKTADTTTSSSASDQIDADLKVVIDQIGTWTFQACLYWSGTSGNVVSTFNSLGTSGVWTGGNGHGIGAMFVDANTSSAISESFQAVSGSAQFIFAGATVKCIMYRGSLNITGTGAGAFDTLGVKWRPLTNVSTTLKAGSWLKVLHP